MGYEQEQTFENKTPPSETFSPEDEFTTEMDRIFGGPELGDNANQRQQDNNGGADDVEANNTEHSATTTADNSAPEDAETEEQAAEDENAAPATTEQDTASAEKTSVFALNGLKRAVTRLRLKGLERSISNKQDDVEADVNKAAIVKALRYRAPAPQGIRPVTAEQLDAVRRTDKSVGKITKAGLEIARLNHLWGEQLFGQKTVPHLRPEEEGYDPTNPDHPNSENLWRDGRIPNFHTRYGLAAEDARTEPPSIFNNWGKGDDAFYKSTIVTPDVGTAQHDERIETEPFTHQQTRAQIDAGNKVLSLKALVAHEEEKLRKDMNGEDDKSVANRARLKTLTDKRDDLKAKFEDLS